MGNSLGCSASGERLVSAARDGDLMEARMLLRFSPCLAKYTTFGCLNSPLHFAAAKGHNDIVTLLLENGAEVNSRNYCGQTALMEACRHGQWEVVQTLLLYRCNVTRADYLSGWTALHFAAAAGHVGCIRLLAADYIPSPVSNSSSCSLNLWDGDNSGRVCRQDSSFGHKYGIALTKFIGRPADGGITALHVAALNGYAECVLLLLDLHANTSAVTFHYGSGMNSIGAGSTPLHYAACGGNLRCCQVLLSRGSSRLTLNCNGWLPADVARMWGRRALEPLLAPNSDTSIPVFPPSNYLTLPLMSILNIARDWGLQSFALCNETELCSVCLERSCNVVAQGCLHEFCVKCALYLCSTFGPALAASAPPGSIPCPLCRNGIISFSKLQSSPMERLKPTLSLRLCNPRRIPNSQAGELCRSREVTAAELICPIACTPFTSSSATACDCDASSSPSLEPHSYVESSRRELADLDEFDDVRTVNSSCSGRMFWSRRCCRREPHQSSSEINA